MAEHAEILEDAVAIEVTPEENKGRAAEKATETYADKPAAVKSQLKSIDVAFDKINEDIEIEKAEAAERQIVADELAREQMEAAEACWAKARLTEPFFSNIADRFEMVTDIVPICIPPMEEHAGYENLTFSVNDKGESIIAFITKAFADRILAEEAETIESIITTTAEFINIFPQFIGEDVSKANRELSPTDPKHFVIRGTGTGGVYFKIPPAPKKSKYIQYDAEGLPVVAQAEEPTPIAPNGNQQPPQQPEQTPNGNQQQAPNATPIAPEPPA